MTRKLAFLSGAPRTSTKPVASLTGGRQHILGTVSGFKENGWQVDTYILGDKVPESWLKGEHEMNKGKPFITRLAADVVRILISAQHIRRALKNIPAPDWVYERYAAYQLFGYFFQRRGAPWILETNDAVFNQATSELKHVALPFLVRWAEKFAYRQCDVLVVISENLRQILVTQLQIPPEKIVVVPNAADTQTFNPNSVHPRRLFDDETFVIGFQGAMYKWAGLDYLVHAIAILRNAGLNVGAVLLGDGHERKHLEALAAELGIASHIICPGRVPRELVPEYIAGYDLCYSGQINWNTSAMYLSPLKLYDYMAMGKPVIASRFADAINVTKGGRLGYLYAPEDLHDLVAAATRAYNDRSRLPEMGAAARAEILANHTWARRVHDFITTAEELLLRKSRLEAKGERLASVDNPIGAESCGCDF
jgi:glycosyltransferase involved in cell wall biosynthesis